MIFFPYHILSKLWNWRSDTSVKACGARLPTFDPFSEPTFSGLPTSLLLIGASSCQKKRLLRRLGPITVNLRHLAQTEQSRSYRKIVKFASFGSIFCGWCHTLSVQLSYTVNSKLGNARVLSMVAWNTQIHACSIRGTESLVRLIKGGNAHIVCNFFHKWWVCYCDVVWNFFDSKRS